MVEASHPSRTTPVLATLLPTGDPRINAEMATVNAGIRDLAGSTKTALVDAQAAFAAVHRFETLYRQPDGSMDAIHPNDAGYRLLAQSLAKILQA
jgi:lysophospholipase L1-like esterase